MYNSRNRFQPKVEDIEFCVNAFNKCRVIQNPDWTLPPKDQLYTRPQFKVLLLEQLQDSLFKCKSQLNTYKSEEWRLHTKKRNLMGSLMYTIRSNDLTELVIQSWVKLWAILHKYEIVPPGIDRLNTVHLCEAPGSFVCALNHFLKQNRPEVELEWLATSLSPYFEDFDPAQVINDDRILRHTLDRWVFGPDKSGNLFDPQLVCELKRRSAEGGKVLLVTADGSQENISSNELVVVELLMAEALAALKVLSKGGTFVMKIFTVCECPTINLVYLLCCSFDEVHLFKPVASREASSEAFLICKGYRYDRDDVEFQDYLTTIEERHKDEATKELSLFPLESIAKQFQKDLLEAMQFFLGMQEEVINANIASFPHTIYVHEWNRRKFIRAEIEKRFFKVYPIRQLPSEDRLCPFVEAQLERFEIDNAYLGSWEEENVIKVQMSNAELVVQMRKEFQVVKYSFEWPYEGAEKAITWTTGGEGVDAVKIVKGGRIGNILSSRFITKRLLNFLHNVLELNLCSNQPALDEEPKEDVGGESKSCRRIVLPLAGLAKSLRDHENLFVDELLNNLRDVSLVSAAAFPFEVRVRNALLIGQRSVGLVFLMSQRLRGTGTEIRVSSEGELIFSNLTVDTTGVLIKELERWQPLMTDEQIHGFVDIRLLRENEPDEFYDLMKIFNIYCCVRICEQLFA